MTKKDEMYDLINQINMNKKMQQVYLVHHQNENYHKIFLYSGEICLKGMFGGNIQDTNKWLSAFLLGLNFNATDFVK
jgi:CDP-glycerol glycerophosphotransferase (TagB/SpsB family)